jgi:hypothetical protein
MQAESHIYSAKGLKQMPCLQCYCFVPDPILQWKGFVQYDQLQTACSLFKAYSAGYTPALTQTEQAHVYSARTGHQTLIFSEMKRLLLFVILPKYLQCI